MRSPDDRWILRRDARDSGINLEFVVVHARQRHWHVLAHHGRLVVLVHCASCRVDARVPIAIHQCISNVPGPCKECCQPYMHACMRGSSNTPVSQSLPRRCLVIDPS
jgi:hypothetical protein